jgi:predicted nucleic acid-binding protein
VITLNTSGVLAITRTQDRYHVARLSAFEADPGPCIIPAGILAEITFMLEQTTNAAVEMDFLEDLRSGAYAVHWDPRDLVRKYRGLPLGFADAAVIACAERRGGCILTTDRHHFAVVSAGEEGLDLLPRHPAH